MVGSGGRGKKLRADRLELLRWRVALQLGYQSVEEWLLATPSDWQAKQLAVAWLDRWGESTDDLLAQAHNSALVVTAAHGCKVDERSWKTGEQMQRTPADAGQQSEPQQDWKACESMFRSIIVGR